MLGTRSGLFRAVGLGVALAAALLLLFVAEEASGGKYAVAQCGWHIDADADWADTTGGAKFRPDAYCAAPPGADPFGGVHMKSFTRGGAPTVSGTRFARWRWVAPPTTGISRVSGTWWHALHDGMQQRIGVGTWNGDFNPFVAAGSTDITPRNFVAGFSPAQPALEDRLLCARAAHRWCSLNPGSWSSVRALTITIEDNVPPAAGVSGELTDGGWRRGNDRVGFWGNDAGGGVHFGETQMDGTRVAYHEYPCAKVSIGGQWRGARMQPCPTIASGSATVNTRHFSDGPHELGHCAVDFAGNPSCIATRTVRIDNNAPAHPRKLTVKGEEGWRRSNGFELTWANPDQGSASPIGGAAWKVRGPGFDTGARFSSGRNRTSLRNVRAPRAGSYKAEVWLRDEAGNEASSSAVSVPLLFDNIKPGVAFEAREGDGVPEAVRAVVADAHSTPASGAIHYRRLSSERWTELPTKLKPGEAADEVHLVAGLPRTIRPGIYVFRADAKDAAGNEASSTRRSDGTEMAVRKPPPPAPSVRHSPRRATAKPQPKAKTRLFARLRWQKRSGPSVTVPFGAAAAVGGRLVNAVGAGLAGRSLRVVSRLSRGAHARRRVASTRTGRRGGFRLALPRGPSRRVTVTFPGAAGLARSRRPALALRVRGGIAVGARPRSLRTGETVRLRGRVRARGAPLPRRGKLVAIQYYESAASRWRPVLVTRTGHGGRFRARYRFRYITGRARIRLRAIALAEERWPYAPGVSRPVVVRVRG